MKDSMRHTKSIPGIHAIYLQMNVSGRRIADKSKLVSNDLNYFFMSNKPDSNHLKEFG